MPTLLGKNSIRYYFFSNQSSEKPMIMVDGKTSSARFELNPVRVRWQFGLGTKEIDQIHNVVVKNHHFFLNKWNEHFRSDHR